MTEFINAASVSEVPAGRAKVCGNIALYHTQQGFYATTNVCPHRGGPLGEGDLLGNEIVCPWHFWSFDVKTGANVADPSLQIPTYEVRVVGDRVMVKTS